MILLRTITAGLTLRKVMPKQVENADPRAGGLGLDPEAEIAGEDRQEDQAQDDADGDDDDEDHLGGILGE